MDWVVPFLDRFCRGGTLQAPPTLHRVAPTTNLEGAKKPFKSFKFTTKLLK